jgi:predicted metal-binding membrane protein
MRPTRLPDTPATLALLLAAAGWGASLAHPLQTALPAWCGSPAALVAWREGRFLEQFLLFNPPAALLGGWIAMLLAMMSPLLAAPLRWLWQRSLPTRRMQIALAFVLGYLSAWMLAAAPLAAIAAALAVAADALGLRAELAGAALALGWQATPWAQRCLNRCRVRPAMATFGWRAERDGLRYGLTHGASCVGACWAWMLWPMTAAGAAHLPLMLIAAAAMLLARSRCGARPRWGWPFSTELRNLRYALAPSRIA